MTNFDNTQAFSEGWGIWSVPDLKRPFRLHRIDCEDPDVGAVEAFASDAEAWRFVWSKAEQGSDYHAAALNYLKAYSPAEMRAIHKHMTH